VPERLLSLFQRAKIKAEWTPGIQSEIWQKFVFICAFGLVAAAHEKTLGQILEDGALASYVRTVMTEVVALAELSGVALPKDIVDVSLSKARGFPYEAKTSFQRDFECINKMDERDLFAGTMLRMAENVGVEVPKTRKLAAILETRKPAC
jgi:2-dehydropantoate 2-reductase